MAFPKTQAWLTQVAVIIHWGQQASLCPQQVHVNPSPTTYSPEETSGLAEAGMLSHELFFSIVESNRKPFPCPSASLNTLTFFEGLKKTACEGQGCISYKHDLPAKGLLSVPLLLTSPRQLTWEDSLGAGRGDCSGCFPGAVLWDQTISSGTDPVTTLLVLNATHSTKLSWSSALVNPPLLLVGRIPSHSQTLLWIAALGYDLSSSGRKDWIGLLLICSKTCEANSCYGHALPGEAYTSVWPAVAVTEELLSNRLNWECSHETSTFYGLISRCKNCRSNYNPLNFSSQNMAFPS